MKVCRFNDNRFGDVINSVVVDVTTALGDLPSLTWPVPPGDHPIRNFSTLKIGIEAAIPTGKRRPISDIRLLSPVSDLPG